MISIKSELENKKSEVEQMLLMIDEVANLTSGVIKSSILKSAYILLLYNMIESTMSMIFERIHEAISTESYDNLVPELQDLWVEFFFIKHPPKDYKSHLDKTIGKTLLLPELAEFSNKIKLFSGNLDGKKLDELLKKYAIGKLCTSDRGQLLIIKNKRNKIAHGEEMFKESCRNMAKTELVSLKKATFSALAACRA
jgi:hypothetical protein